MTTSTQRGRVQAGVPAGGQFAASTRPESDVALAAPEAHTVSSLLSRLQEQGRAAGQGTAAAHPQHRQEDPMIQETSEDGVYFRGTNQDMHGAWDAVTGTVSVWVRDTQVTGPVQMSWQVAGKASSPAHAEQLIRQTKDLPAADVRH